MDRNQIIALLLVVMMLTSGVGMLLTI